MKKTEKKMMKLKEYRYKMKRKEISVYQKKNKQMIKIILQKKRIKK